MSVPLDQILPFWEKTIALFRMGYMLASHSIVQSQASRPEELRACGTGQDYLVVVLAALTLEVGNVGHFTHHLLLGGEEL